MSMTLERQSSTTSGLTRAEAAYLTAWGEENGLEVIVEPAASHPAATIAFIGYDEGIPCWSIYRAEGRLWLCDIEYSAGRQRVASKAAVTSAEQAADRILAETEA